MDDIDENRKKLDENKDKMGEVMEVTLKTAARDSERAEKPFQGCECREAWKSFFSLIAD